MAGKHIYIQQILDSLLSGIDGALAGMEEKLQDVVDNIKNMMGGEDPQDQKSLHDVVEKLDGVVGEDNKSLSNVVNSLQENSAAIIGENAKTLSDVVTQLQDVVNAITHSASGIFFKPGDTNVIDCKDKLNIENKRSGQSASTATKLLLTTSGTGVLNINVHYDLEIPRQEGYSYWTKNEFQLKIGSDSASPVISFGLPSPAFEGGRITGVVTKKLNLLPGDIVYLYYNYQLSPTAENYKAHYIWLDVSFDNGVITQPEEIIVKL